MNILRRWYNDLGTIFYNISKSLAIKLVSLIKQLLYIVRNKYSINFVEHVSINGVYWFQCETWTDLLIRNIILLTQLKLQLTNRAFIQAELSESTVLFFNFIHYNLQMRLQLRSFMMCVKSIVFLWNVDVSHKLRWYVIILHTWNTITANYMTKIFCNHESQTIVVLWSVS